MDNEKDITKLKYVLYARKSTDDAQRQIRSIEDQISECEALGDRLGIKIVKPYIRENKSAKKPNKRPLFTKMLSDIKKGIYDGIIAWNPDRLARNMKEGGEIIDMIDEDQIKDLKFVTHHFTDDANGKMLLGMAFVLSKQYSDKLSQDVTRGVRSNFSEGKTPSAKHGYLQDENKLYRPDGNNFKLIREAWEMRLNGISLKEIALTINEKGYVRSTKSGKKIYLTNQILADLFKNPFYYGILIQAEQKVDLREIYDFEPMITEEEYVNVQRLTDSKIKPYKSNRTTYYPLKMMVTCFYCKNHMYAGASRSSTGKRYLFYRCDKDYCQRLKKSMRGKVVFDFIYDFLEEGLNFSEEEYKQYLDNMTTLTINNKENILIDIHSKEARIRYLDSEIKDISYKVLKFPEESIVRKNNEERLMEYQLEAEELKAEVSNLKNMTLNSDKELISLEQFLNLSKNASKAVQLGDSVVKDAICRLIFLNLIVDDEKVASYQLKPPFDELLKTRKYDNVGERGLEPPTSRSQTARSSQLSYSPFIEQTLSNPPYQVNSLRLAPTISLYGSQNDLIVNNTFCVFLS